MLKKLFIFSILIMVLGVASFFAIRQNIQIITKSLFDSMIYSQFKSKELTYSSIDAHLNDIYEVKIIGLKLNKKVGLHNLNGQVKEIKAQISLADLLLGYIKPSIAILQSNFTVNSKSNNEEIAVRKEHEQHKDKNEGDYQILMKHLLKRFFVNLDIQNFKVQDETNDLILNIPNLKIKDFSVCSNGGEISGNSTYESNLITMKSKVEIISKSCGEGNIVIPQIDAKIKLSDINSKFLKKKVDSLDIDILNKSGVSVVNVHAEEIIAFSFKTLTSPFISLSEIESNINASNLLTNYLKMDLPFRMTKGDIKINGGVALKDNILIPDIKIRTPSKLIMTFQDKINLKNQLNLDVTKDNFKFNLTGKGLGGEYDLHIGFKPKSWKKFDLATLDSVNMELKSQNIKLTRNLIMMSKDTSEKKKTEIMTREDKVEKQENNLAKLPPNVFIKVDISNLNLFDQKLTLKGDLKKENKKLVLSDIQLINNFGKGHLEGMILLENKPKIKLNYELDFTKFLISSYTNLLPKKFNTLRGDFSLNGKGDFNSDGEFEKASINSTFDFSNNISLNSNDPYMNMAISGLKYVKFQITKNEDDINVKGIESLFEVNKISHIVPPETIKLASKKIGLKLSGQVKINAKSLSLEPNLKLANSNEFNFKHPLLGGIKTKVDLDIKRANINLKLQNKFKGGLSRIDFDTNIDLKNPKKSLLQAKNAINIELKNMKFSKNEVRKILYNNNSVENTPSHPTPQKSKIQENVLENIPNFIVNIDWKNIKVDKTSSSGKVIIDKNRDKVLLDLVKVYFLSGILSGKVDLLESKTSFSGKTTVAFNKLDVQHLNFILPTNIEQVSGKISGKSNGDLSLIKADRGLKYKLNNKLSFTNGELKGLNLSDNINSLFKNVSFFKEASKTEESCYL
jgi:hypothetical protein